jgi:hypothetical protein
MPTKRRKIGPRRLAPPWWVQALRRGEQLDRTDERVRDGLFVWLWGIDDAKLRLPEYGSPEGERLRRNAGL